MRGCLEGGGGGGSGGSVLLESPTVTVEGVLAANGGGGADATCASANPSADATPDDVPAVNGMTGGAGAAGTFGPQPGIQPVRFDRDGSGGGGGAAGRIRMGTTTGKATVAMAAIVSPSGGSGCFTEGKLASKTTAPPVDAGPTCDVLTADGDCERCLEASCCSEVRACQANTLCAYCLDSPAGPACKTNTAFQLVVTCRKTMCPTACPALP
jgi:hypothetical protein